MEDFAFHPLSACPDQSTCPVHPAERSGLRMDLEAVTLRADGVYGLMYRTEPRGPLFCTCGWSDDEASHECRPYSPFGRDPRTTAITEADGRMLRGEGRR